jgi:hypothetical protein
MTRANLLGIFAGYVCLAGFAVACGESPGEKSATGGSPAVGGASGSAGTGVGGTPPGAGTSAGGSLGGSSGAAAGTAGTPAEGGTAGSVSGTGGLAGDANSGAGGAASGTGGSGGVGGSSGAGGAQAGAGGAATCTFTVNHTRATVPTVETVTFSTDLAGVTSARIDFGLAGSATTMSAPVNLAEPMYRTWLLGMKPARDYVFRIVATSPAGTCTSQDYTLTTGARASNLPTITRTAGNAAMQDRGFIITSGGVAGGGGGGIPAYIIDADGDIVWWAAAPGSTSRARMSYDGRHMYMMALNVQANGGEMRRVLMDGTMPENNLSGLSTGHHDFTVLPDNGIAVIIWSNDCSAIVERSATGQLTTVVANVNTIYQTDPSDCHTNAINYYPSDQSYTLSDRNVNLFVKIRRNGELVWQFGGNSPRGQAFTVSQSWQVNHGHQLMPDGKFVFFNNGPMGMSGTSAALEYQLNETSWTATKTSWEYRATGVNSPVLSDVQRLPNGNTLVTYSTVGEIHEVSPTGTLIQRLDTQSLGYAEFRKTLYGPPLR